MKKGASLGCKSLKNKTMTINLSAFIIPNNAYPLDIKYEWNVKKAKLYKRIAELNNIEYDPANTALLQLWFHNNDTDNFCRHGGVTIDGHHYNCPSMEYLPIPLFEGKKEGETINLLIPFEMEEGEEIVEVSVTLQQQGYRYQRFGTFEEVLKQVS